ncbi:hypothetical protein [Streptomyces sp. NPDC050287]|uniref:hypothetical protein n=1 Tax=Streptomyces sp. NPDC050287 TaxID=3365608 RepID=UPI0037A609DB
MSGPRRSALLSDLATDPARTTERMWSAVAPHPEHFQDFLAKCSTAAHAPLPWTSDDLRALSSPTLLVIGDTDFVRVEHAAEMQGLIPHARPAVLPATTHMSLIRRTALLLPMLDEFLS